MTCVFFGHSNTPQSVYPKLKAAIIDLIQTKNVTNFYVGNHGDFDKMTRNALRELKADYPHINYKVILAYLPGKKDPFKDYSDTEYPEGIEKVPQKFAINYRNKYMVEQADYVISYISHSYGGAAKFVEMARKKKAVIINLSEAL